MSALSFFGLLIVAGVAFAIPLVLSLTPARRLPASILELQEMALATKYGIEVKRTS